VSGRHGHRSARAGTGAVLPQTLPDTSVVVVRHAVQVPDTADGLPHPVSVQRMGVVTGTGRRVGGRWWDAASADGCE
jgi:hypothetical protein